MTSTSCNALCHASAARCLVAPRLLSNERHSNRNPNLSMSPSHHISHHFIKARFCAAKLICISRHGVFGALWPCNHTRVYRATSWVGSPQIPVLVEPYRFKRMWCPWHVACYKLQPRASFECSTIGASGQCFAMVCRKLLKTSEVSE